MPAVPRAFRSRSASVSPAGRSAAARIGTPTVRSADWSLAVMRAAGLSAGVAAGSVQRAKYRNRWQARALVRRWLGTVTRQGSRDPVLAPSVQRPDPRRSGLAHPGPGAPAPLLGALRAPASRQGPPRGLRQMRRRVRRLVRWLGRQARARELKPPERYARPSAEPLEGAHWCPSPRLVRTRTAWPLAARSAARERSTPVGAVSPPDCAPPR